MRSAYIVAYDISNPDRLRRVFRTMRGYGDRIQYSVFRCELSDAERVRLEAALTEIIHQREDQVLLIPIGPPGGRNDSAIRALGRAFEDCERRAFVV